MKKINKLNKLVIASVLSLSISVFTLGNQSEAAATYTVKAGDTYWKIAQQHGVSVASIKKANNKTNDIIYPGQSLVIPGTAISAADKELMAKLVYAEAKGESYAGKVAVATVLLNRVDHPEFPNTVRDVIYQKSNGYYAFSPVQNGAINQTPDAASRQAVNEAIAFRGQGSGSLYFYNPQKSTSAWMKSRTVTIVIGNHAFAK